MLCRLVVRKVIEEDGAQNRALGIYIRRKRADGVLGSSQGFVPTKTSIAQIAH